MRKAPRVSTAPAVYQCSCGAVHNSADAQFPIGWSQHLGVTWCEDCTASGVPARELRRKAA